MAKGRVKWFNEQKILIIIFLAVILSLDSWSAFAVSWNKSDPLFEPAIMLLLGSGLIGLAGYVRRNFFKKKIHI